MAEGLISTRDLLANANDTMVAHWMVGGCFTFLTCLVGGSHVGLLWKWHLRHERDIGVEYVVIVAFGLFCGVISALGLFFPREYYLLEVCRSVFEAFALYSFMKVMILLAGGTNNILETAAALPARNWYRVPPFVCLCACRGKKAFDKHVLRYAKTVVKQFILSIVLIAVFEFWVVNEHLATPTMDKPSDPLAVFHAVEVVSMLFAMHGLFVIYSATRKVLKEYHTTRKFVCVKLVIFLGVVDKWLVTALVRQGVMDGSRLGVPVHTAQVHLESLLGTVQAFVVTSMLVHAFSISELDRARRQHLVDYDSGLL